MRVGYFPGCSLHGTSKEYHESLVAISRPLNIELAEIEDWSCCGATSAHATNHLLGIALAARNLSLAEGQGYSEVVAPCAACFNRLATARYETAKDTALAERVRGVLSRPFSNRVEVRNVLELLRSCIPNMKVTRPLKDLKLACYYGCLLVRPPEVCGFDDPEDPTSMEELVTACGATPVTWNRRLDCCGGGFSLSRTASVVRLSRAIISDARKAGAQAIVVACPMCHSNLDFRQKAMGESQMPVLFITQVIGMALGLDSKELGLERHFVPAAHLFERGFTQGEVV